MNGRIAKRLRKIVYGVTGSSRERSYKYQTLECCKTGRFNDQGKLIQWINNSKALYRLKHLITKEFNVYVLHADVKRKRYQFLKKMYYQGKLSQGGF